MFIPNCANLRGERQCGVSGTLCHVRGMVGRSRDASPGRWMLRARERRCSNGERGYEVGEQGLVADEFDSAGGEVRVKTKRACL